MQITRDGIETAAGRSRSRSFARETACSSSPARTTGTAAPTRFMTHLAMIEVDDDGNPARWGDYVTDEEYGPAPPVRPRARRS